MRFELRSAGDLHRWHLRRSSRLRGLPMSARNSAWAGGMALLLVAARADAQNFRESPIGGRTATMGGAATAAGNDSAMPYLNPAGLAGVPGDIFAVSATVYSYTHRSFKNFFLPQGPTPGLVGNSEDF